MVWLLIKVFQANQRTALPDISLKPNKHKTFKIQQSHLDKSLKIDASLNSRSKYLTCSRKHK